MNSKFSEEERMLMKQLSDRLKIVYSDSPAIFDNVVGNILVLTVDQDNPKLNYQKLLNYLESNPNADGTDVIKKVFEIIGKQFVVDKDKE